MELIVEKEFIEHVPDYRGLLFEADVVNSPVGEEQMAEMDIMARRIAADYEVADINKIPAIAATRAAYKACGKDPNRYRPSQEQLMRRIVRGLGLYNVSAVVDAGNQLSLLTGCSVGCFDRELVEGDILRIGIGRDGEPYEGIGRGVLNIAGLPVVRDASGGIGTPTSDNERTKISGSTRRLVATVHLFDPAVDSAAVVDAFADLFTRHCSATDIRYSKAVIGD